MDVLIMKSFKYSFSALIKYIFFLSKLTISLFKISGYYQNIQSKSRTSFQSELLWIALEYIYELQEQNIR